jgi:hypothetical protein
MGRTKIQVNTGDRYGKLRIIKEAEPDKYFRKFVVECDCGNLRTVYIQNLRNGLTKSCGCMRDKNVRDANTKHTKENLIGVQHGMWTIVDSKNVVKKKVVKQVHNITMKKVKVQCEHCGHKKEIYYNSFIYKNPCECNCQKPSKNN